MEKFKKIVEKLVKNEDLVNEISKMENIDEIYEKFKSIDPELKKEELNNLIEEIKNSDLENIAGGVSLNKKVLSSSLGALMAFSSLGAGAMNSSNGTETNIQKNIPTNINPVVSLDDLKNHFNEIKSDDNMKNKVINIINNFDNSVEFKEIFNEDFFEVMEELSNDQSYSRTFLNYTVGWFVDSNTWFQTLNTVLFKIKNNDHLHENYISLLLDNLAKFINQKQIVKDNDVYKLMIAHSLNNYLTSLLSLKNRTNEIETARESSEPDVKIKNFENENSVEYILELKNKLNKAIKENGKEYFKHKDSFSINPNLENEYYKLRFLALRTYYIINNSTDVKAINISIEQINQSTQQMKNLS